MLNPKFSAKNGLICSESVDTGAMEKLGISHWRQRFRRAGCGGAGAGRPAPRRAAIGRGPAPSADWVWRTCEAYPPPPGRAADGERFISARPSLTAPLELRTPTSARTPLSRPEHYAVYATTTTTCDVWTVTIIVIL